MGERARELLAAERDAVIAEMEAQYGPGCSNGVAAIMLHDSLPETFTRDNWKAWFFKPATGAFDWATEHKLIEPVAAWRMTPLGMAVSERMQANGDQKPAPQPDSDLVEKAKQFLSVWYAWDGDHEPWWQALSDDDRARAIKAAGTISLPRTYADGIEDARPIQMILHCPKCGVQHIDAPEMFEETIGLDSECRPDWHNPPHRSHLCHGCGCIWRPADVATEGVREIATTGKADTWLPSERAAIRTLSPSPSWIGDAREALTKAGEAFRTEELRHMIQAEACSPRTPTHEAYRRREEEFRQLATLCESASEHPARVFNLARDAAAALTTLQHRVAEMEAALSFYAQVGECPYAEGRANMCLWDDGATAIAALKDRGEGR